MDSIWRNLRIAFPEKTPFQLIGIRIRFYLHLLRLLRDWFRLDKVSCEELERLTDFVPSLAEIKDISQRRPIIFFTGHVGNWEYANLYGECVAGDYGVLVKEQKGWVARVLAEKRLKRAFKVYLADRNEKSMLREGKERALGIVIDHRVRSGIKVRFFSKGCFFPKGVLWLIRRLGARAVASFVVYPKGKKRFRLMCREVDWEGLPSDEDIAQRFTDELERVVREYPEQYLWTFKRWKFSWELKVLVLKDGRPGHWRQSLAVVEYIKKAFSDKEVSVEEADLSGIEGDILARSLFVLASVLPVGLGWWLVRWALKEKAGQVLKRYADVVVSAGSSLAGLNIFLRRLNQSRSIVVMDPGWGMRRADLLIVPEHDGLKRKRVVSVPGAVAFFDKERAERDAERLSVPWARVAVFIGGPIGGYDFESARIRGLLIALREMGKDVLVTTSRRTPNWVEDEVERGDWGYKVIANKHNPEGVVGAMMVRADKILVTADSISMVSEALASGKQVGVWVPVLPSGKHGRFLLGLFEKGWAVEIKDEQDLRAFVEDQGEGQKEQEINLAEKIKQHIEL